jgi:hypothetical protein
MTQPYVYRPRRDQRRRRPGSGRKLLKLGLGLVLVAAVFAVGVALGEALHDNPKPGGTQTLDRTLRPLPLAPAPVTVTVTVKR